MYFKKNKKEGFAYTSPTDATQKGTFKADVEEALGDNLTAIKNLGTLAGQLLTSDGLLDLSTVDLKVKSLDVAGNSDLKGNLINLAVPKLIGSACFNDNGTGAQATDPTSNCGQGWSQISSSSTENNKGITWGYVYPKAHGSACGGTNRKCQNVYSSLPGYYGKLI